MLERLVENWLDSAGERSYQPCFCQMLTGQGYRIVHNTEHTPLEFGKDVIALSPAGRLVGYQLKGNPHGTLKPSQFNDIRGQLEQLATLALAIPGLEGRIPDECFLVTNGEVDEAVYHQLQLLNASLVQRGHSPEKIQVISRGTLLNWSRSLGHSLWPSENEDFGNLVKLLNHSGKEMFPARIFDPMLRHTLSLGEDLSSRELARRVTSAAILTSVALHSFSRQENYFAELTAWLMFTTYVVAACEKNGRLSSTCKDSLYEARCEIYDLLGRICAEAAQREILTEGDPCSEFAFYRPRLLLVSALMSVYWIWSETEAWEKLDHKRLVEKLIPKELPSRWLWGEAAIPQFLTVTWYWNRRVPPDEGVKKIAGVLNILLRNKLQLEGEPLASPYYDAEEVVRHNYNQLLNCSDPIEGDGFECTSYVCESLLMCLVRANAKEYCQALWPSFTKIGHENVSIAPAWEYGLFRAGPSAINNTTYYPSTLEWTVLQEMCKESAGDGIPSPMKADPIMLLLFVNVFPFRANYSAIKYLQKAIDQREGYETGASTG